MPVITAVYLVILVMFTQAGPVARMIPVQDFDTCESMARSATDTFFNKKVPLQLEPAPAPMEPTLVLYAEARCVTVTKKDTASREEAPLDAGKL